MSPPVRELVIAGFHVVAVIALVRYWFTSDTDALVVLFGVLTLSTLERKLP